MLKRSLILVVAASVPLFAQATANPAASAARLIWESNQDFITQSAADVPENLYSFRPTPDVRTFGEIIGHVAGAQGMFCAIALGEKVPAEDAVEKTATTKAALVDALKKSNEYCARAYAMTDQAAVAMVDLFGQQRSKLYALMMNASHNAEHYGNLVTYMRINKIVPPSSRPGR